jgi:hypothetical protein
MTEVAIVLALLLDLAAAAPSALTAEPLRGPFPSLEAACGALRGDVSDPDARCSTEGDECSALARAHTSRFGELRFFRFANMCYLAGRVDGAWYIGETSLGFTDRHESDIFSVVAAGNRVVVTTTNRYWWLDHANVEDGWYDLRRNVTVCGLVRGVPACTPELVIGWSPRWEDEGGERKPHRWRWRYDARLDGGALVVEPRIDDPRVPASPFTLLPHRPSTGRYPLPF